MREGLWIPGDRFHLHLSRSRAYADLEDLQGRSFTMLDLSDFEDLADVLFHMRQGELWGRSGRFAGDTDPDGKAVLIDQKHAVRMRGLGPGQLEELDRISSMAIVEMTHASG